MSDLERVILWTGFIFSTISICLLGFVVLPSLHMAMDFIIKKFRMEKP